MQRYSQKAMAQVRSKHRTWRISEDRGYCSTSSLWCWIGKTPRSWVTLGIDSVRVNVQPDSSRSNEEQRCKCGKFLESAHAYPEARLAESWPLQHQTIVIGIRFPGPIMEESASP